MIKLCSVLKYPQIVNMYINHIIPNVVRSESSLSDITFLITFNPLPRSASSYLHQDDKGYTCSVTVPACLGAIHCR